MGCYESSRFKSKPKPGKLGSVALLGLGQQGGGAGSEGALAAGAALAAGSFLTRFLVEAPPNVCTPSHLAAAAADIAAQCPSHFSLEVRGMCQGGACDRAHACAPAAT